MDEPTITLSMLSRMDRKVLGDCRWKIRTFVERDAYAEYDHDGGYANPSEDVITDQHVHAMNCAMRARSSRAAWGHFTGTTLPELREIPRELDLVDGSDAEVRAGHDALTRLSRRFLAQSGLTDVSVSKVLYLLRPNFVAISDSYVRKCLGINESGSGSTTDRVDTLLAVQRGIRGLGKANRAALSELFAYANDLPPIRPLTGRWAGQTIPVRLSKIRISTSSSGPTWRSTTRTTSYGADGTPRKWDAEPGIEEAVHKNRVHRVLRGYPESRFDPIIPAGTGAQPFA